MAPATINIKPTDLLDRHRELVQSCITGDRNSQKKLYDLFAPKMYGVCKRYSKSSEEAEEIMQDGFVQVFKSLHNFKFSGALEGWIRTIMVYCAIQHYRSKPKLYPVILKEIVGETIIDKEDILTRIQEKELLKIVQDLSPGYRIVFNLYVFEGFKHREIAKKLGISEGTSKSNLTDARKILRNAIINSLKIAQNY